MLDELQVHLHEFRDVDALISTIWHALQKAGLTWKKALGEIHVKIPPIGGFWGIFFETIGPSQPPL